LVNPPWQLLLLLVQDGATVKWVDLQSSTMDVTLLAGSDTAVGFQVNESFLCKGDHGVGHVFLALWHPELRNH
jgi:hypothetical protein